MRKGAGHRQSRPFAAGISMLLAGAVCSSLFAALAWLNRSAVGQPPMVEQPASRVMPALPVVPPPREDPCLRTPQQRQRRQEVPRVARRLLSVAPVAAVARPRRPVRLSPIAVELDLRALTAPVTASLELPPPLPLPEPSRGMACGTVDDALPEPVGEPEPVAEPMPAIAPSPEPETPTVFDEASVQAPPRRVRYVAPRYPVRARRLGRRGTVELEFVVTRAGRVAEARVVESTGGGGFDTAAMTALSKWRFEPGRHGGEPVDVRCRVRMRFALER